MQNKLSLLFLFLLTIMLAGCGFHLRGSDIHGAATLSPELKIMFIDGVRRNSALMTALRADLTASDVQVVDSSDDATAIMRILSNNFNRRTLSVSSASGKVREFELHYEVTFVVNNKEGDILVPTQRARLVRDFTFDETRVLGKDSEESILRKEMEQDIVQQILIRLQAHARKIETPDIAS